MRTLVLMLLLAAGAPSIAAAQEKRPPAIKRIQVGFKTFQDDERTIFKVGLWTPIYVEIFGGTDGIEKKATDRDSPYITISTVDSEDVGTEVRVPVSVEPLKSRTFLAYLKPGHSGQSEIGVTLNVAGRTLPRAPFDVYSAMQTDQHLYLTVGSRMTLVQQAVKHIGRPRLKGKEENFMVDTAEFRNVVFETDVDRLPERWFGYNNIDLLILGTENRKFLTALNRNPDGRLAALADWVRRGGRLVVPIAPANQDAVSALLSNAAAWQPAIPVVPPAAPQPFTLENLAGLANWANVNDKPFEFKPNKARNPVPIPVAVLEPARFNAGDWEPGGYNDDKPGTRPLYAHVRYGLGKITYVAISLEDISFFQWEGRDEFLESVILKLAPITPAGDAERIVGRRMGELPNDLSTDLVNALDNFDVHPIDFGFVALFIVLYILVVGPLDFVLLKYVFKRLEWTWITFPTVVLAVSVIAYFAAYALKGRNMKINKVDIVDFDLRTDVDARGQPRSVHAYGTSFFTILSPRIQNYTVGMEANPLFWGAEVKKIKDADEVLKVDLMSWMGRPSGGPNDMGRGGGAGGFFRRPYAFAEDYSGLESVPIPVWTTKAFVASWEQLIAKPPFVADLIYHQKDPENKQIKVSGKLENHLGVDLVNVWLFYNKRIYPIPGGLKAVRIGSAPPDNLALTANVSIPDVDNWARAMETPGVTPEPRSGNYQPTTTVKSLLFGERVDVRNERRNHLLRPLDLGWRIQEAPAGIIDHKTREAILFARVRFATGSANSLSTDTANPLPTKLWLGKLPEPGERPPALSGVLNQDTFIRVLLAVRPADE